MEYSSNFNFNHPNASNKEQPLFESDESESEFDAFEHHLSQYEHRERELFSDEDEQMEHDGDRSATDDDDDDEDHNQISLATSFCKNVQEQNEDFLDGKFNGDQLLEPFSEDKFIKCKYSEDFYVEQQAAVGRPTMFSEPEDATGELFNSDQCLGTEPDKLLEERSSEDERVIESRKRHFLEFISTIPKVCTPSVCGMMQSSSGDRQQHTLTDHQPNQLNDEEILFEDDEHALVTSTQKDPHQSNGLHGPLGDRFNWSIDQMATLNPVEISINERRYRRFKEFESDQLTQEKLSRENELFFSQGTIAPSPSRRVFKNIGLGEQSMHEKADGKDSGNYSADERQQRETMTNLRTADDQRHYEDEEEFSFMRHASGKRISNIEFDGDFELDDRRSTNTPDLRPDGNGRKTMFSSFQLPSDRPAASEWTQLDFKPDRSNVLHQTSTPCTLFKLKEFNQPDERRQSATTTSGKMPLQERANSVKQKRRLFHHHLSQNEAGHQPDSDVTEGMLSIGTSLSARRSNAGSSAIHSNSADSEVNISNNSSDHSCSNCSSLLPANDEGICQSSREVTFGSSNESSMMSVCDNNSLTPKLRRSRSIAKSFAERLNELELFNDENKSNNTNLNPEQQNNSRWMHNLTDSNCFMIKNLNVHLNNSDSGCYMSSGSASNGSASNGFASNGFASNGSASNGSAVDASGRRRLLFN